MTRNRAIVYIAGLAVGLVGAFFGASTPHVLADSPWDPARTSGHYSAAGDVLMTQAQSDGINDSPWD
jgi:hypothetical protein